MTSTRRPEPLHLNAYWGLRRLCAQEVAGRIVAFVRRLETLHPALGSLASASDARPTPLDASAGDEACALAALALDAFIDTNPDPADTSVGPLSLLATGFSLALVPADMSVPGDAAVMLLIAGGGFDVCGAANHVSVELPCQAPSGLVELPLLTSLMRCVVACWSPERAWVLSPSWHRRVKAHGSDIIVGWLTSIASAPPAVQTLGNNVCVQPLGAGTLVTLGERAPEVNDPGLLATAQTVARALQG